MEDITTTIVLREASVRWEDSSPQLNRYHLEFEAYFMSPPKEWKLDYSKDIPKAVFRVPMAISKGLA